MTEAERGLLIALASTVHAMLTTKVEHATHPVFMRSPILIKAMEAFEKENTIRRTMVEYINRTYRQDIDLALNPGPYRIVQIGSTSRWEVVGSTGIGTGFVGTKETADSEMRRLNDIQGSDC